MTSCEQCLLECFVAPGSSSISSSPLCEIISKIVSRVASDLVGFVLTLLVLHLLVFMFQCLVRSCGKGVVLTPVSRVAPRRSEERRVGKEGRCGWLLEDEK